MKPVVPSGRSTRRRDLLIGGAAAIVAAAVPLPAAAHAALGPVTPPVAAPGFRLVGTDGTSGALKDRLTARITAVQLMFTSCSATCPIQGAIFADAQARLAQAGSDLRLLSISIDPLSDDAAALKTWLARFGAQPRLWSAASPRVQDLDPLLDFLRGRAAGPDRHTAQAFLFDRQARLAFRTTDMPAGGDLVHLMQELASLR